MPDQDSQSQGWCVGPLNTTSPPISPTPQELVPRSRPHYLRTAALYGVLIALLYFALHNAPFAEILKALKQLRLVQIAILFVINAGVILASANPGFYLNPATVTEVVDFVAGKLLDLMGVPHEIGGRWDPDDPNPPLRYTEGGVEPVG